MKFWSIKIKYLIINVVACAKYCSYTYAQTTLTKHYVSEAFMSFKTGKLLLVISHHLQYLILVFVS